jgi:hypothetical protein
MFDPGRVAQDRRGPVPDRILVAQITGTARHHARWRDLTADEETAAVTELRELAAGRSDLLAEVAGLLLGFHEGDLEEPRASSAANLCMKAGVDQDLVANWITEGRSRATAARMPPPRYS